MNKIKVVTKAGQTMIVIKGMRDQLIQRHELEAINNNGARGLLYLDIVEKRSSFQLVYDVTGYITLQKLLAAPQNKESFIKILTCIQKTLRSMEDINFDNRRLLLDFEKVMVNPATGEIVFVYVPVQPFDSGATMRSFMLDISSSCVFPSGEDTDFVKDYILMLDKNANFSLVELERYLEEVTSGKNQRKKGENICPKCSAVVRDDANFCMACGTELRGSQSRAKDNGGSHYGKKEDPIPQKSDPAPWWEDLGGDDGHYGKKPDHAQDPWKDAFQNDHGYDHGYDHAAGGASSSGKSRTTQLGAGGETRRTTQLGAGGETRRTTQLGSAAPQSCEPVAFLIRRRTGERVRIDRDCFKIGYDWSTSDYAIGDNEAISTRHAQILTRNGRYYVMDMGSTNHTYVDRRMIRPREEMEIYSGTMLSFANEDFVFEIEDGR